MHGELLGYSDGKVLGYDKGIKLELSGGKVFGAVLGNVDVITLGIHVGIDLGSLDVPFHSYNDGNLEGLFLRDSLGYTDGKVPGSDE